MQLTTNRFVPRHLANFVGATWIMITLSVGTALAGKYNRDLDIGQPAPAWRDLPGVDGKEHALEDLVEREVVVVVFTCNSCPYAEDYEDRIIRLATAQHEGGKVAVVAINVNNFEADRLPEMKRRAEEKKYPFPYLHDATQQIARDFGAGTTPEFFVLNKKREVVYMGALDDNTDAKKVQMNYVEQAIASVLAGETPAVAETVPIGCRIRWEGRRRPRGAATRGE